MAEFLLRQTPGHTLVCGLPSSAKQNRQHLSRYQRFTLAVESAGAVHAAYRSLEANRAAWKIKDLEKVAAIAGAASLLFSDLNGNWWEITSAQA